MTCGPTDWRPKIARFLEGNAGLGWAAEFGIIRGTTQCEDKKERATEKLGWACLMRGVWAFPFLPNEKVRGGVRPDSQVIHLQPERQRAPKVIEMGKLAIHPSSFSFASPDLFHYSHFAFVRPTRPVRVMRSLLPFVKRLSAMVAIKFVTNSAVPQ